MDAEEPAAVQDLEMEVVQQQPQLDIQLEGQNAPSGSAGGGPTMSTYSDAPPDYSDIAKELHIPAKSGISVQLPGQVDQPQVMYCQAAPPPYGNFAQSVQYLVPGVPPNTIEKYRTSHDFMIFSVITSIICGIFSIGTLSCSIPAVVYANQSFKARGRADYQAANRYSNCALGLTLAAIISGLLIAIVVTGIYFGQALYCYSYCNSY